VRRPIFLNAASRQKFLNHRTAAVSEKAAGCLAPATMACVQVTVAKSPYPWATHDWRKADFTKPVGPEQQAWAAILLAPPGVNPENRPIPSSSDSLAIADNRASISREFE
jgi:hypothetical protein